MTDEELLKTIKTALAHVAPEIDFDSLDPTVELREQADLDSVDFLNFVIQLHQVHGFEIPETDYPKLQSIAECLRYLKAKQPA